MKKVLSVLLVLALAITFAGCGPKTGDEGKTGDEVTKSKVAFKIAHTSTPENVRHLGAEEVQKYLEAQTDKQYEVQLYPSSQLGSDKELIEGMQSGNVEMVILPVSPLGGFQPLVTMLDLPFFLPDNKDDLLALYKSDAMKSLFDTTEEVGVKIIGVWHTGYKQFTANKPLLTPADYKGLKYRTQPSPILIETVKALGGSAVNLPFAEVYSALQTGAVDAQGDNPLNTVYDMKFNEVQTDITMTNHGTLDMLVMVSKKWFDSLPGDVQQTVVEAAQKASDAVVDKSYEVSNNAMELMEAKGNKFHEISDEQRVSLQEQTKSVKDFYLKQYGEKGKQLMAAIEQAIKELK